MSPSKLLLRLVIPLGLVGAAVVCAGLMLLLRPGAEQTEPARVAALVEVREVVPGDEVARVRATGVARPARQITLTPEVQGRIVEVSDRLVPGGRFAKGDVVARIDPRDFQLAVEQETSRVRQAELEWKLEQGRQSIAQREWALLGEGRSAEDAPLALREPHLATAEQALASARSGLERARLNLERTVLRAPFDAVVIDENVDVGQVVGPSTLVASLVGTETLWIKVGLPVEDLARILVPDADGRGGSEARVVQRLGEASIAREGRVVRLLGELDPQTRTAQLLVAVPDPFGASMPLLPGAYVDVEIRGRAIPEAYRVPRVALDRGEALWVVGPGDVLARRAVTVAMRGDDDILVTEGLRPGDRVVVTPLSLPIEGMPIRPQRHDDPAADGSAGAETM